MPSSGRLRGPRKDRNDVGMARLWVVGRRSDLLPLASSAGGRGLLVRVLPREFAAQPLRVGTGDPATSGISVSKSSPFPMRARGTGHILQHPLLQLPIMSAPRARLWRLPWCPLKSLVDTILAGPPPVAFKKGSPDAYNVVAVMTAGCTDPMVLPRGPFGVGFRGTRPLKRPSRGPWPRSGGWSAFW